MAGDQARRSIDLVLAVEGVEQSSADLLGCDRQVIEPVAALARQRCWRHIQVTGKIKRHCAVEQAAHGLDRIAGFAWLAADPFERLVDGVCIGEASASSARSSVPIKPKSILSRSRA